MLKKFGQRPGVQRTFRFSSRTSHAFNIFFLRAIYYFFNLNFNHEIKQSIMKKKKTERKLTMKLTYIKTSNQAF